ncbi:MAG: cation diffusion facilitator family transporter [Bacteroidaceae bacterium]
MSKRKKISNRRLLIHQASLVGIFGNATLSILKVAVGLISGSAAVIADGIDSASDVVGSLVTNLANKVSELPPDKEHPFGHTRIETAATAAISFLIVFAGIQLIITAVGRLCSSEQLEMPGKLAIVVTLLSIAGKLMISQYQSIIAKKTQSPMVKADSINMRNDVFLSIAVLIGLIATFLIGLPIIDKILGLILGFWIVWTGAQLFLSINSELMDSFPERDKLYTQLFKLIDAFPEISNPHKVRIRKINYLYDIDLDIEVDGHLSVFESHKIAMKLEQEIKKQMPNIYDVLIHVEPLSNQEDEQFGLTERDFK